jgi:LPXTG-motif cell wall-anchored protein
LPQTASQLPLLGLIGLLSLGAGLTLLVIAKHSA